MIGARAGALQGGHQDGEYRESQPWVDPTAPGAARTTAGRSPDGAGFTGWSGAARPWLGATRVPAELWERPWLPWPVARYRVAWAEITNARQSAFGGLPGVRSLVGVAGLEPTASRSQSGRATNCAIPRHYGPCHLRLSVPPAHIATLTPAQRETSSHSWYSHGARERSSMVEPLPSKQITRVRFPSSAWGDPPRSDGISPYAWTKNSPKTRRHGPDVGRASLSMGSFRHLLELPGRELLPPSRAVSENL